VLLPPGQRVGARQKPLLDGVVRQGMAFYARVRSSSGAPRSSVVTVTWRRLSLITRRASRTWAACSTGRRHVPGVKGNSRWERFSLDKPISVGL
jgi:hypothetical protein